MQQIPISARTLERGQEVYEGEMRENKGECNMEMRTSLSYMQEEKRELKKKRENKGEMRENKMKTK
jgi:hypothetical protein